MINLTEEELQEIIDTLKELNANIKNAWGTTDDNATELIIKLEIKKSRIIF